MNHTSPKAKLTLGPLLFNWTADVWRDFYFRIADESCVDSVVIGETVCSKRTPFYAAHIPDVVERLEAAGKEVALSSLALIMNAREMDEVRDTAQYAQQMIEANDVSVAALLKGKPHAIGPYVNVYNEGALDFFAKRGATRVCLPVELGRDAFLAMVRTAATVELEVHVFGRLPLAISARCYHARHHGLHKDSCQFVCEKDVDGLDLETMDGERFLAVNGLQTLSYTYQNLMAEMAEMRAMGIHRFRLSPHSADMVAVSAIYRDVLDDVLSIDEADKKLSALIGGVPFSNGFYYGAKGVDFMVPDLVE